MGLYDDEIAEGGSPKADTNNGHAAPHYYEEAARNMYPAMKAERERDGKGGMYAKMEAEHAQAAHKSNADFELTMMTDRGAGRRQAAREQIAEKLEGMKMFPSMAEGFQTEIDTIVAKFAKADGTNWLDFD